MLVVIAIFLVRSRKKRLVVSDYGELSMNGMDLTDVPFQSYYGPVYLVKRNVSRSGEQVCVHVHVYMCACVHVCMSFSLCLCLSLSLSRSLSLSLSLSLSRSLCVSCVRVRVPKFACDVIDLLVLLAACCLDTQEDPVWCFTLKKGASMLLTACMDKVRCYPHPHQHQTSNHVNTHSLRVAIAPL